MHAQANSHPHIAQMHTNTPQCAVDDKSGGTFLPEFGIFIICTNQAQTQIVSPPPGF